MTGGDGADDEPAEDVPRSGLRAAARDRRVWAILAVVAFLLVCCCSTAAGTLLAIAAGLFTAG
ncbi:hypothetical protein GA0070606_2926 [Micromonospora citrea]|uniref:Uncharacterized protein n=1 Tax=Micromonospora citrea TaxID=47855 RepID=A0A1C6UWK6_9ACTN|nr:hypothetical protein [Micromonospora citrea]SCL58390.1 hypothetical protein GA0070606_2926 [Micromonospora citrea]